MCRLKSDTIDYSDYTEHTYSGNSTNPITVCTIQTTTKGKILVRYNVKSGTSTCYVKVYINGTVADTFTLAGNSQYTSNEYISSTEYASGTTIMIQGYRSGSGDSRYMNMIEVGTSPLGKTINYDFPIYPANVKSIGSDVQGVIYGINSDGTYVGGIIRNTSISAGGALGYLECNYNGTIIKIPYYAQ